MPPMPRGAQIPRASARWKSSPRIPLVPDTPETPAPPGALDLPTVSQRLDELHARVDQNNVLLLRLTDTVSNQSTSLARLIQQVSTLLGDRTNRIVRGDAVASHVDANTADTADAVDATMEGAPTVL